MKTEKTITNIKIQKTQNEQNSGTLQKCPKGQKRENSIKEGKKRGKKEKEVRTRSKTPRYHAPKPNAKEKARGKHKELRETGYYCHRIFCNNKR